GIYLHMGIMFGLPLQIALAVLALGICAMVVMGYIMWWRRRPTKNAVAGVPGQAELSRTDWVIIALVAIPVGLFLPLLGISFAAMGSAPAPGRAAEVCRRCRGRCGHRRRGRSQGGEGAPVRLGFRLLEGALASARSASKRSALACASSCSISALNSRFEDCHWSSVMPIRQ